MKKSISIEQLRTGMFLVGIDLPWYKTPFLLHKFQIKEEQEITRLRDCGVREVQIDPTQGLDLDLTIAENGGKPFEQTLEQTGVHEPPKLHSPASSTRYLSTPTQRILQDVVATESQVDQQGPPAASPLQREYKKEEVLRGPIRANGIGKEEEEIAKVAFHEAAVAVENVFTVVAGKGRIDGAEARKVVKSVINRVLESPSPMFHHIQMQALRRFDSTLFIHVLNVCVMSLVLGHKAGVKPDELEWLGLGALLHDVGHMRIPRNLLRKKGKFTKQEKKIFDKHPELGASLLAQSPDLSPEARRIVAEHHERIDGSGSPHGLAGPSISPLSQIVSLADHHDTIVNGRRGCLPLPPAQAVRELFKMSQSHALSPKWVDQFINIIGIYPVGSLVEFNTGERGIVVAENPLAKTKPMVTIIADLVQRSHFPIDLSLPATDPVRKIIRILDPTKEDVNIGDYIEL